MPANLTAATASHLDHRHWQSDIACWKDDIENWQGERMRACEQLQNALCRLEEHGKSMEDHAGSVTALESSLEYHERNLAKSLRDDSHTELDESLAEHHKQEENTYQLLRDSHEHMKKLHHQAMARVTMVARAFDEAS